MSQELSEVREGGGGENDHVRVVLAIKKGDLDAGVKMGKEVPYPFQRGGKER